MTKPTLTAQIKHITKNSYRVLAKGSNGTSSSSIAYGKTIEEAKTKFEKSGWAKKYSSIVWE